MAEPSKGMKQAKGGELKGPDEHGARQAQGTVSKGAK